jgi:hypothetical protein
MPARSLAVLLEGDGDYESVPLLIRNIAIAKQYHDLRIGTKPIKVGDAHAIQKSEKFLRLFEYAISRDDIDGVLITADCEDYCPVEAVRATYHRVGGILARFQKPVGIAFFCREYETMFLTNAVHIAERSASIQLLPEKLPSDVNLFSVRNAKGLLRTIISTQSYKETRDQARLTGAMDVQYCASGYRPLMHLINVIDWFYMWDGTRREY